MQTGTDILNGAEYVREDIAELANVLAWDAVGAQIEPYLVQHAEWQRPCGVALGCRSLNSRGIKCCGEHNTIKSLSLSCRHLFFLSILKTIRSERAEGFSLRQGVWFIMDANKGNAPVRKITNGQKSKTLLQASTEEL